MRKTCDVCLFFFSSRRRHTRYWRDWSSDVCLPILFEAAIAMSGTFRLEQWLDWQFSDDLYFASPLHFLPGLQGPQLETLRQRFVVLASGEGAHESIGESWAMAETLGAKGIPNRVDNWGPEYIHDWPTWWEMLPKYLREIC